MKKKVEDMSQSLIFLSSEFYDLNNEIKNVRAENTVMRDEISVFINDVFDRKNQQNEVLRLKVDEMEQYSRNNM